jgi:AAA15 family ATPase/GTPase
MKIQQLEYQDQEYNWLFKPITILPKVTLLVGISGVGKTQILKAIFNLKKIANGGSLNGVKWKVIFSLNENIIYHWEGEFETQNNIDIIEEALDEQEKKYRIMRERLYLENEQRTIIDRTQEYIYFNGEKTPKLSPYESAIELLDQEDDIAIVKNELDKILFSNAQENEQAYGVSPSLLNQYKDATLTEIQNSDLPIPIKLVLADQYKPEIITKIKNNFQDIFPKIEDIKFGFLKPEKISLNLSILQAKSTLINLKEEGVENWIQQSRISSGMLKTLMFLSELYLSSQDSVILIDEFENSLGVNCIDSITQDLLFSNNQLQFIITSHHPYIINNISPKFWKIVTRKAGVITVYDAQDFHISPSQQKAFIDLINVLEDYPEGL